MGLKKFIVTTTINSPTLATRKFAEMKDWTLVVVGDTKTPHLEYEELDCIYLSPSIQETIDRDLSDSIGWKSIQRRNIGFLYAYNMGADIVATVDDDNIPLRNWGKNLLINKKTNVKKINVHDDVFDPLFPTNYKKLWHRGFPLDRIDNRLIKNKKEIYIKPDVQADFWDSDPDIDCICRVMYQEKVLFKKKIYPFYSNKLSPFNTQNTFFDTKIML